MVMMWRLNNWILHTKVSLFKMNNMNGYPLTGFHFSVRFDNFNKYQNDIAFQEVSGLSITVDVDSNVYKEGGQNRFVHRLPGRTKYADLILKRGTILDSEISDWCIDAIENF